MGETDPIGWRAIRYGTPVLSKASEQSGTVREVLGSDAEDIFHGIRVRLADGGKDVVVAADDVASMTRTAIGTTLSKVEIEAAPAYDEVATFHLASVGWLRKHLGWAEDSKRDEEPG